MVKNNLRSIVRSLCPKYTILFQCRHSLALALVPASSREVRLARWRWGRWGGSWRAGGTRWTGSSSASTWPKMSSSISKGCRLSSLVHDFRLVRQKKTFFDIIFWQSQIDIEVKFWKLLKHFLVMASRLSHPAFFSRVNAKVFTRKCPWNWPQIPSLHFMSQGIKPPDAVRHCV